MATSATRSREPILGYEVTERIGAGGYGEVWKANAPGGLTKAIKFVYGYLDDERARRELKALSRVKLVRHPFLLSLERIEVVDGQLVIVTELADMSLKDRHEECKAAGMVGIPRDELLGYLRDAADALDYMRDKYSLQHLDVKPENLLLVAGHVKVADFGLVKDIDDTRASMMGGLTPIYASPEVFDDRPSQCSDQYSLAIVFQEMLTDTLPFPGKTTAQLAAQHLQSRPRLTALPPDDKPIIDRALSKDPTARYATAREMVDALSASGRLIAEAKPATVAGGETTPLAIGDTHQARPAVPAGPLPATSTQMLDSGPPRQESLAVDKMATATCVSAPDKSVDSQAATSLTGDAAKPVEKPVAPPIAKEPVVATPLRRPRAEPVIRNLPPLAISEAAGFRPLLMVGLGGTARLVVNQFERRIADRFGDVRTLPAFRLLSVDTDASDVGPDTDKRSAPRGEFLKMPLRRPEDYRRGSTKLLSWMSRRWLYNIPRSLETEGLRPLGRLALVDHAEQLVQQLNTALDGITAAAAVEASAAQAGLPVGNHAPRIVLLSSICGGTGGGMALDVAYLLRRVLRDRGLPDDCLTVALLHWSARNASAHELAVANSFGVLSELTHFYEHGYPGEPALGLAPTGPAESCLPGMYLVNLGDELVDHELTDAARSVADYLFLGTARITGSWLDTARRESFGPQAEAQATDPTALRTFGVCRLGAGDEVVASAADDACGALLGLWCGSVPDACERQVAASGRAARPEVGTVSSAETDRLTSERIALMALSLDNITEGLEKAAAAFLGSDVDAFLQEKATQAAAVSPKSPATGGFDDEKHPQLALLDEWLGLPASGAAPTELVAAMEAHLREVSRQHAASLRAWTVELTNNHRVRLAGATRAIEEILRPVRELRDAAQKVRAKSADELRTAAFTVMGAKAKSRLWPARGPAQPSPSEQQSRLLHYAGLRFMDSVFSCAVKFVQMLTWELSSISEALSETRRELSRIATLFEHDGPSRRGGPAFGTAAIESALRGMVEQRLPEVIAALDEEFERELFAPHGGLCAALASGKDFREQLIAALRTRSRTAVLATVRAATVSRQAFAENDAQGSGDDLLRSCLAEAMPDLASCGGDRRLLVLTNRQEDVVALTEAVTRIAGHAPSVVVDGANDPALCYEIAGLPLWEVAASLVDGQPHCAALAARLHTRCDIEWTPLALPE